MDIRDREGLATTFEEVRQWGAMDTLIHLAAPYDFSTEKPDQYWQTNVEGRRAVLEETRRLEPRRLVFASSLGFSAEKICDCPRLVCKTCLRALASDPDATALRDELRRQISMTVEVGSDQVLEIYELNARAWGEAGQPIAARRSGNVHDPASHELVDPAATEQSR